MIRKAWLTINRACNCKCEWCYAKAAGNGEMSLAAASHCLEILHDFDISNLVLIGGEPTLHPDVFDIIRRAKNLGMKVAMATNGLKLSDAGFSNMMVKSGINSIDVSIKGLSPTDYIAGTGVDGYYTAVRGINNLLERGFRPTLSYLITGHECDSAERLSLFLERNHFSRLTILFPKPSVNDSEEIVPFEDIGKIVASLVNSGIFEKHLCRVEASFPLCLIPEDCLDYLIENKRIVSGCHVSKGSGIIIDEKGRLIACNHFIDYPFSNSSIFDCSKEEVSGIFFGEQASNLRRVARHYPFIECVDCKLWEQCGGGCFARWLGRSSEYSGELIHPRK